MDGADCAATHAIDVGWAVTKQAQQILAVYISHDQRQDGPCTCKCLATPIAVRCCIKGEAAGLGGQGGQATDGAHGDGEHHGIYAPRQAGHCVASQQALRSRCRVSPQVQDRASPLLQDRSCG